MTPVVGQETPLLRYTGPEPQQHKCELIWHWGGGGLCGSKWSEDIKLAVISVSVVRWILNVLTSGKQRQSKLRHREWPCDDKGTDGRCGPNPQLQKRLEAGPIGPSASRESALCTHLGFWRCSWLSCHNSHEEVKGQ